MLCSLVDNGDSAWCMNVGCWRKYLSLTIQTWSCEQKEAILILVRRRRDQEMNRLMNTKWLESRQEVHTLG